MSPTRSPLPLALFLSLGLGAPTSAAGSDVPPAPQLLDAARIVLTDAAGRPAARRLELDAAGPAILPPAPGTSEDPTLAGGFLHIRNPRTGEEDLLLLPAEHWALRQGSAGARYRYRDLQRAAGPCSRVDLRPGRLRVQCRGADLDLTLDEPAQETLAIQLGFGELPRYCVGFGGVYGGQRSQDFGIGHKAKQTKQARGKQARGKQAKKGRKKRDKGKGGKKAAAKSIGRFAARSASPPSFCPFTPTLVRAGPGPGPDGLLAPAASMVRGLATDAPILGWLGAINSHTLMDAAARDQYNAGVLPLVLASGAVLIATGGGGMPIGSFGAPADWAQSELEAVFYTGGPAFLEFVTHPDFRELAPLKRLQAGDSLRFIFQRCLWDCDALEAAPFFPPAVLGRMLVIQFAAPSDIVLDAVPALGAEAAARSETELAWAGRSVAEHLVLTADGELRPPFFEVLSADGTLIYALTPGADATALLALPELAEFLLRSDAYVATEYGP